MFLVSFRNGEGESALYFWLNKKSIFQSDHFEPKKARLVESGRNRVKGDKNDHDHSGKATEKKPKNEAEQKFSPEKLYKNSKAEAITVMKNDSDPSSLNRKQTNSRKMEASDSVTRVEAQQTDQKRLDEIRVSIENELERKVEAVSSSSSFNLENLTVELKSGGEVSLYSCRCVPPVLKIYLK